MPVQLESAVVFALTRHLNDQFPRTAGGILIGAPAEDQVEVTESFPLPANAFEGEGSNLRSKETFAYQQQVIQKLGKVDSDTQVQGWYISSTMGGLFQQSILDQMFAHYQENPESITLVHDVALSKATKSISLRAFQLSQEYLAVRAEKFSSENLEKHGLNTSNILVEIPIFIHNTHLVNLLSVSSFAPSATQATQLAIPEQKLIEGSIESISDGIDDFMFDQSNFGYYQRQLAREKQKVQQWQLKRRGENAQRVANGEQLLSMDEWKLLFKMPEEPSRLDNLLLSAQLKEYCQGAREIGGVSRTNML